MKLDDLVPGVVIGHWTVIDRTSDAPNWTRRVLCRCECGTERPVTGSRLLRGESLSCGCVRTGKEVPIKPGTKFQHWTVVERAAKLMAARSTRYQCICECGTPQVLTEGELRAGKPMSCGCASTSKRLVFQAGSVYGRWTILGPSGLHTPEGRLLWRVRCVCGRECEVAGSRIKAGYSKGCGCERNGKWAVRKAVGVCNSLSIILERRGNVFRADCKTLWCDGAGTSPTEALEELAHDVASTIATVKLGVCDRRLAIIAAAMSA